MGFPSTRICASSGLTWNSIETGCALDGGFGVGRLNHVLTRAIAMMSIAVNPAHCVQDSRPERSLIEPARDLQLVFGKPDAIFAFIEEITCANHFNRRNLNRVHPLTVAP